MSLWAKSTFSSFSRYDDEDIELDIIQKKQLVLDFRMLSLDEKTEICKKVRSATSTLNFATKNTTNSDSKRMHKRHQEKKCMQNEDKKRSETYIFIQQNTSFHEFDRLYLKKNHEFLTRFTTISAPITTTTSTPNQYALVPYVEKKNPTSYATSIKILLPKSKAFTVQRDDQNCEEAEEEKMLLP